MTRRRLLPLVLLAAAGGCKRTPSSSRPTEPAAIRPGGHPRLWIPSSEVPRLRARAGEPVFRRGLEPLADELREAMDAGELSGPECRDEGFRTCESYAELFAFMSLVHPDADERADYARRGRQILMGLIERAAKGPQEDDPIRDPSFSVDDRSRWSGEAFALATDWLYPHLSAADKQEIRKVFLRWSGEIAEAKVTDNNHPVPEGAINDPRLITNRTRVRWAGNNYYAAHMRNLGLMAMALDPEDDPGGELRSQLEKATGSWLYVENYLLTTDARGGLGPEGLEYGQQTMSYVADFLLALETAGLDDPDRFGDQVVLDKNDYWSDAIVAYAHILSPAKAKRDWRGPGHDLAWYGDGQKYKPQDFVDLLAPIGIHAGYTGNKRRLDTVRWLQKHTPPGGAGALYQRMRKAENPRQAILYFLLDPDEAPNKDPRAEMPLVHFARGLGHVYARTGWDPDAAWFRYICGWIAIDHQHAEGNHFGYYRRGEWLTKMRVGYSYKEMASSQSQNTITIKNDRPDHNGADDYRHILWERGSQWTIGVASGDCEIEAMSAGDDFVAIAGDATALYNSDYEGARDVAHASRSILWLEPDHIVVYDRVASRSAGRFKRFWLHLPRPAAIKGSRATMETERGQRLYVTSLLPEGAAMTSGPAEPLEDQVAEGEPMKAYLEIEPKPPPRKTRFLTVLQGADKKAPADRATLVRSDGGELEGAAVADTLVLFPVALGAPIKKAAIRIPDGVDRLLLTGLAPDSGYAIKRHGSRLELRLRKGGGHRTDDGGVLDLRGSK